MGAAIWSTDPASMLQFPARFFVRFLHNHGMLTVDDRPAWRTVTRRLGALRREARRAVPRPHPTRDAGRAGAAHRRRRGREARGQEAQRYDAVFLACHSDQALRAAGRPERRPSARCSARFRTRRTRPCCTPTRACCRAGAARGPRGTTTCGRTSGPVALTYNMNILQRLEAPEPFLVTLNRTDAIDPARVLAPHDLPPSALHAGVGGRAGAGTRDRRRAAHVLLRRLLAQRLPRGRRRRAHSPRARVTSATTEPCTARSTPVGLATTGARAGAARVRLPASATPGSTSPSSTRCSRGRWLLVDAPARARVVASRRLSRRPRRRRWTRPCAIASRRRPAGVRRGRCACSRMLRTFGHCFNPVTLLLLLRRGRRSASKPSSPRSPTRRGASATRTCCRRPPARATSEASRFRFDKRFHVSPFMPMDQDYDWRFRRAGRRAARPHGEPPRAASACSTPTLRLRAARDHRREPGPRARCATRS